MKEATIQGSIRAVLMGAAAMTASIAWAQSPQSTTTPTNPATTEAPSRTDSAATDTSSPQSTTTQSTTPDSSTTDSTAADATSPPTSTAQTAVAIDDQKIDQFADAYVAVQKIQSSAASELDSAASDPAKQQQAQAKVESEMIAAVERTGLKLDEFNGIVQTMSADADLRARVVAKIRERMGG